MPVRSEVIGPIDPPESTAMHAEAAEAGAAVSRFLAANRARIDTLAARLRADPPRLIVTCARGSSDHAATYGKYLFETLLGVPVSSAAPAVSSVFGVTTRAADTLCLAISQSGRSPDLLASVAAQRSAGAYVVAIVNDATSPLADLAHTVLPLEAGPERSVAATKSYIVSLVALAALAAVWSGDARLAAAIDDLPTALDRAFALDWSSAIPALNDAVNLFVVGRGYGLGIAQEAALKLKETCAIHAEAFSAAEVRHGPMAIIAEGFPVLAFATSDRAGDDVRTLAHEFAERGATVIVADAKACDDRALPAIAGHAVVEPILMIASFYRMANLLSIRRGGDPDTPPYLAKITTTV